MANDSRHIVLTGASRGLGLAMAKKFIALGHTITGCARNEKTIVQLRQEFGEPHRFDVVDVTDAAGVQTWADEVVASRNAPDLLINNAAIINANATLWEVPADEFDRVVDINIKGVANVIRSFVPAMIVRGEGIIVNLSSGWGRVTSPEVGPYCATKWAIEGLSKALAQELPSGLASIPLNPGIIDTDMLRSCFGSSASSYDNPEHWAERAVPMLLGLTASDSGESLSVG